MRFERIKTAILCYSTNVNFTNPELIVLKVVNIVFTIFQCINAMEKIIITPDFIKIIITPDFRRAHGCHEFW
jgi:hypothetical protein